MVEPDGRIVATSHTDPRGFRYLDFRWEGGPLVELDWRVLRDDCCTRDGRGAVLARIPRVGEVIWVGPFRLLVVQDNDRLSRSVWAIRIDSVWAPLRVLRFRLERAGKWWSDRIIVTLAVWGQAEPSLVHPDTHYYWAPRWSDVYAVRWLKRTATRFERWMG